ncbi:hypothetical protein ILUMI_26630 [Ignelater luminosus]|uniref:Uncharacterized protein n=1 Tax=Ignelater luminosus TaxID=2038154 RepID=A0A8K0C6E9_IGNLU|nr:hypothetical protein ILUMI_26630 [Ignelater luminosus]
MNTDSKKTTSAIRMQKLRQKRKLEDPDYQRKETERIRLLRKRKRELMSPEEWDELKRSEREKKRIQEAREKQLQINFADRDALLEVIRKLPYACNATYADLATKKVGTDVIPNNKVPEDRMPLENLVKQEKI